MRTGTAATRETVSQAWSPVLTAAGVEGQELGRQILALAHQVAVHSLSAPLTDPGREAEDKVALARRLFTGTVDERVVDLLSAMVRGRWSKAVDLVSALHDMGIEAILAGAHAGGSAEEIEQQLFEVHEQIADNRELREALTHSRRTGTEARVRLAEGVFAPHISAPAMSLVDWCVRHHAEGGPLRNLRRVVELAAEMRQRTIVDVVTAIPMTSAQEERLRTILERRLGTRIDLNCEVDSAVIGGARISTRNYVMDRTVRSAVAELHTRLAG